MLCCAVLYCVPNMVPNATLMSQLVLAWNGRMLYHDMVWRTVICYAVLCYVTLTVQAVLCSLLYYSTVSFLSFQMYKVRWQLYSLRATKICLQQSQAPEQYT